MANSIKRASTKLRFDNNTRTKVGLIVLSTDFTCEKDFYHLRQYCQLDWDFYVNRIAFTNPINEKNLTDMLQNIRRVSEDILPDTPLDALVFNCTSASAILGKPVIEEAINREETAIVTTAYAACHTIKCNGYNHIDILSPYNASVSLKLADYFEQQGITVTSLTYLDIDDDRDIALLSGDNIVELAKDAISPQGQALFISCTAMQVVATLEPLREQINRPIFSSNLCAFQYTAHLLNQKIAPLC